MFSIALSMLIRDRGKYLGVVAGITFASLLVIHAKPIPAFRLIGHARLLRVDNEAVLLFSQEIHPCAGRKIVRRLGAAVKHDD